MSGSVLPTFTNSIVQGSGGSTSWDSSIGTDGGNNLDVDPLFVSALADSTAPFTTGDYTLQSTSPAIDAGSNELYSGLSGPSTDLAGNTRILNDTIDMGAYENAATFATPVVLSSFKVSGINNTSLLQWQTSSETNNSGFDVERSFDGSTFSKIGFVSGSGTSSSLQRYSFTDGSPQKGINYYRLKQIDLDGSYSYSDVRSVTFDAGQSDLKVYPNPAVSTVYVANVAVGEQLKIFGMDGKVYRSEKITASPQYIDVSGLASGVYIIQVLKENKVIGDVKFIKK